MPVEALVGPLDERAVEPTLAAAGFIARDQQHSATDGVERERDPPLPSGRAKPKLLHVRMPRTVECVHSRPPELRTELPQKVGQGEDGPAYWHGQREELGFELLGNLDRPAHGGSMLSHKYEVNDMPCSCLRRGLVAERLGLIEVLTGVPPRRSCKKVAWGLVSVTVIAAG